MQKRVILGAAVAVALAAAGVATAAAVTNRGSSSRNASQATAGRVTLHKTKLGKIVATRSGRTLYLFMADHNGKSSCYGQCASYWPPLMKKGKVSAGAGIKAGLLGTTRRKNGKAQVTYKGHPLYLFSLDKGSGQVAGQGQNIFGGKWFVVSSAGKAIKAAPPSTTTGGTTTNTNPYPYP